MSNTAYDAELKIPSNLIYLRPVRSFMRDLAENAGFSHKKVSNIELAVDEIFTNAIEHGSAGSGSQIVIHCLSTDEMMRIVVSDAGRGKDSESTGWLDAWSDVVKEKTQPGTERGHGLFLAHNLADEISIEPNSMGGVDVHLVIYREEQRVEQK